MNGADPGGHEETGAADRQSTAGTQRIDGRQTARAARHAGHPPGRHQQPEGAPLRFFFYPTEARANRVLNRATHRYV